MNELFSYRVTVFEADDESKKFKTWYEQVWRVMHPKMDDFNIEFNTSEGEQVVEVIENNPDFPLETLYQFYLTESAEIKTINESKEIGISNLN